MSEPVRIGILGAARIAPMALVRPAREVPAARIVAVAARDRERAQAFAVKHGVPKVHGSYEDLLADPDVDAIYNPLPNSHHYDWTIRALAAGKHVLCEKPLAANTREAEGMAQAASEHGRVLMEAFHWRYHPLTERVAAILNSGEIGTRRHIEAHFAVPLWIPGDIRYRLDLAGGALMDTGCYAVSILRFLAGEEPQVTSARARLSSPGVDRAMEAEFRFPSGATGKISSSLFSRSILRSSASVEGSEGRLAIFNPVAPHIFHRLSVTRGGQTYRERVPGRATYTHQLEAFVAAVRDGSPVATPAEHGVANMRVIDAIYEAAGLAPRG